ncbi:cell division protein FtsW [Breznakia sp. PH1-1]|nr:cell division protein FtsW [Breznakia sp. PH1-1]MDH6405298.1 cell division protein FtsW [Breznakia sp. PF1-11]MDH6413010.1 cell division protein FtsW [Breznakia sp. PFB1-11]MDH6415373.1 cell division protein FtsW [Breznakia sp. PFB1-14]MDH6417677.1 cell division protein FtsW [Breznakia sp. PFB1-4]MDH6420045.1 cell division protein FtsW [Breznakia sp. PFB1-12]MDH6475114.1 cell division protein FtsW [Breznakia sp. PFB2-30]MDH6477418.1 cell division protein FtsW [Breznakia sp. PFB1-19]
MKKLGKLFSLKMPPMYDRWIHAAVIILIFFGTIMVVSTSVGMSAQSPNIVRNTIIKQVLFLIISYFAMVKVARVFQLWLRNKNFLQVLDVVGVLVAALLVFVVLFSTPVNGAKSWIQLPGGLGTIQPSEFAKAFLIVYMGVNIYHIGPQRKTLMQIIFRPTFFFIVFALLIIAQPDFGTIVVLTMIFLICNIVPSHFKLSGIQTLCKIALGCIVVGLAFSMTHFGITVLEKLLGADNYQLARFINADNPFTQIFGTGYNLTYSLYAIANGGITGLGLGQSAQKYGYLPEAETDFILPVTIEELGLFGLLVIVIGYGIILYRLFYFAKRAADDGTRMILVGTAVYLSIHFILNVGGVSAFLPLTGVPLLFISSGGSSLLSIMVLMGVCQSIISLIRRQRKRVLR